MRDSAKALLGGVGAVLLVGSAMFGMLWLISPLVGGALTQTPAEQRWARLGTIATYLTLA